MNLRVAATLACFAALTFATVPTSAAGSWKACTVSGTQGDDRRLEGTARADVICGLGGDDKILGLGGDDIIRGGDGADVLIGGEGDDRLSGGRGEDQLFGRDGADHLIGGRQDDILEADDGSDVAHGGRGSDSLYGTDGDDVLRGGRGDEHCMWSRDHIAGDSAFGGPGIDRGTVDDADVERSLERHTACWG